MYSLEYEIGDIFEVTGTWYGGVHINGRSGIRKAKTSDAVRFCGGGALSDVTSQILADITGRTVQVVDSPQNVGAVGAAAVAAAGLGEIESLDQIEEMIPVRKTFRPDQAKKQIYDRYYQVFRQLYKSNRKNFLALNREARES